MARTPDKPRDKPAASTEEDRQNSAARIVEETERLEAFDDPARFRIGAVISRAARTLKKRRPSKRD